MRKRSALVACLGMLAAHNSVGNLWLPRAAYVPVNLAVGAVLVALALSAGTAPVEIVGPRALLRRGLGRGLLAGALVGALVASAAVIPAARDAFTDQRVVGVGGAGLAYQILLRIPFGTAAFEELAFRGVLPALARHVTTARRANLGAAVAFGLWHVLPASSVASGNAAASGYGLGVVIAGAVAATATAGLGLSWLRDRYGLAAPIVLHAMANGSAFTAAWLLA